jgi:hypothetical protein
MKQKPGFMMANWIIMKVFSKTYLHLHNES